jgi:hypothetical protein
MPMGVWKVFFRNLAFCFQHGINFRKSSILYTLSREFFQFSELTFLLQHFQYFPIDNDKKWSFAAVGIYLAMAIFSLLLLVAVEKLSFTRQQMHS